MRSSRCSRPARRALQRALAGGAPYLILDGKVVDTDRCREKTTSRKGNDDRLVVSGEDPRCPSASAIVQQL